MLSSSLRKGRSKGEEERESMVSPILEKELARTLYKVLVRTLLKVLVETI